MNEEDKSDMAFAAVVIVGMMSMLAFIDYTSKPIISDDREGIVFTQELRDSKEYKECAKKNLRTIKQFKGCLKLKEAM